jgi:hypothetical protein
MSALPACKCGHIPATQSVDQHYPMSDKHRQFGMRKDYRVMCHRCGFATPWRQQQSTAQAALDDWHQAVA